MLKCFSQIEETTENKEYLRKLVKAVNDDPSLGWKVSSTVGGRGRGEY